MKINPKSIVVGERLRILDPRCVETVRKSMASEGQQQSIKVYYPKGVCTLVFGNHRLEAAKKLGWTEIDAEPMLQALGEPDNLYEIRAKIAEIDENTARGVLTSAQSFAHEQARLPLMQRRVLLETEIDAQKATQLYDETKALAAAARKRARDLKTPEAQAERQKTALNADKARKAKDRAIKAAAALAQDSSQQLMAKKVLKLRAKELVTQHRVSLRSAYGRIRGIETLPKRYLKALEDTRFDRQNEIVAVVQLLKRYPDEAEKLIERVERWRATPGIDINLPGTGPQSPAGLLKDLTDAALAKKDAYDRAERLKTEKGRHEILLDHVNKGQYDKAIAFCMGTPAMRRYVKEVESVVEAIDRLKSKCRQAIDIHK